MKIAIIGAGIAGLSCAERLCEGGIDVVLFDKGRRPGGRLSTYANSSGAWDYGTQYIAPGNGGFAAKIEAWRHSGLLADWSAGPAGAMVGMPGMAALVEAEAARRDVRFAARVQRIDRRGGKWSLAGAELCAGPFDAVVLAIPAEQAAPLLALHDLTLAREAAAVRSQPCWTAMAAFPERLAGVPDVLQARGAIAWAARNSSKPGRPAGECWVIQAGAAWSLEHLGRDPDAAAALLLGEFARRLDGASLPEPSFLKGHRWRFAMTRPNTAGPLWNPQLRLGACGDWCAAPYVSGAWQSGQDLAMKILQGIAASPREQALSAAK